MKIFLALIDQYKKVEQNICLLDRLKLNVKPQESFIIETDTKEDSLINHLAEVERYNNSMATFNLEKENFKKKIIEINEDDFNIILTIL